MNKTIIDNFKLLIKQIMLDIDFSTGERQMINMYRLRSIKTSLKAIENFPNKITSSSQLKNIKGVGKGTMDRIDEIIKTGKLSEVKIDSINNSHLTLMNELEKIFGIGRKKAYDLVTNHNITSIDDLKKKIKQGNIEIPDNIIKGLKYYGQIKENIPRKTIDEVSSFLTKIISSIDPELFGIVCGSYRRLTAESGDVDYIVVHPKIVSKHNIPKAKYLKTIIEKLKEKDFIIASLTGDNVPTKYMGLFKWKTNDILRIDIRFVPYRSYYSAILYFTGSRDFNRKMRKIAMDMGYMLNEYGLYDEKGKQFNVKSEKDIFNILGMEYVEPNLRR